MFPEFTDLEYLKRKDLDLPKMRKSKMKNK